jgi:hypothetical protein
MNQKPLHKEVSEHLRNNYNYNGIPLPMATHYEDCWKHHRGCLMTLAADLLDTQEQ